METIFFQNIEQLNVKGRWTLHLDNTGNEMVLAVTYHAVKEDAQAALHIPDLLHRGNGQYLDRIFFDHAQKAFELVQEHETNMDAYLKAAEEARKKSLAKNKGNGAAGGTTAAAQPTKEQRYAQIMEEVDKLAEAGKPKDAWMKCPDPKDYPDKAEAIRKRKSELSAIFSPQLFND
jgi:hypothetical protein